MCTLGVQGFRFRTAAMSPVRPIGSAQVSGADLLSSKRAQNGHRVVRALELGAAGYSPLLPHDCDQILDADDIDDSFEIIDENGETHFSSYFLQSPSQKVSMIHPPFDGAKWMFHNTFTQFDL